jgi:hypothetical protein
MLIHMRVVDTTPHDLKLGVVIYDHKGHVNFKLCLRHDPKSAYSERRNARPPAAAAGARQHVRWSARAGARHTSRMHARRPDTCRRGHVPLRALYSSPPFPSSHNKTERYPIATADRTPLKGGHSTASMGDRHQHGPGSGVEDPATLLRRVQTRAPNSTQVVGFLTLLVSGAVLLLLTGVTLTGAVVALVFLGPIALLTSPIWVPVAVVISAIVAAALSACAFAAAALPVATWMYRYFTGRHPVGADRVDYARSRIADTASHVKDYAREYGGYLRTRAKDAAPGA